MRSPISTGHAATIPGKGSEGLAHSSVLAMDHLSVELEFLARLASEEADAWEEEATTPSRGKNSP